MDHRFIHIKKTGYQFTQFNQFKSHKAFATYNWLPRWNQDVGCSHNAFISKNIDFIDKGSAFHFEERVKLFDKDYFEGIAKQCNLNILHTFGNYQLQEFEVKTSPRLILVLQKK